MSAATDAKVLSPVHLPRYELAEKGWTAASDREAKTWLDKKEAETDDVTEAALSLLAGVWHTGWGLGSPCGWITSAQMQLAYAKSVAWGTPACPYLLANWDAVLDHAVKMKWVGREYGVHTRAKAAAIAKGR
jgi:hypothetical protein